MSDQNRFHPNFAVLPGSVIDEHREFAALTQAELAQRLGLSVKHVNRLLAGLEPITPDTALKLEAVFGLAASVWLGLEARYKEFEARKVDAEKIESELRWLDELPHRSMAKLDWIPKSAKGAELVRCLRSFFGVGSLDYLPSVWGEVQAAYRKTEAFASHEWAMVAWLAKGEQEAQKVVTRPFDAAVLRAALPDIKALSRLPGTEFVKPLVEKCANAGVAVVFVPAPKGARVCGATQWLNKDTALVQLSLRYKTDDQLWFTIFHELGHVLLHGKREQFIDFDRSSDNDEEAEANDFAAKQLVNRAEFRRFVARGEFGVSEVCKLAEQQCVSPGIVVGQLQHEKHVPYRSTLSRLKKSFRFANDA